MLDWAKLTVHAIEMSFQLSIFLTLNNSAIDCAVFLPRPRKKSCRFSFASQAKNLLVMIIHRDVTIFSFNPNTGHCRKQSKT
jgi:hypothetical protein